MRCESRALKWGLGSWGCGVHEGAAGPSQRGFLLALGTGSPSGPCAPCTRVWFCPQNGPGQLSRTRAGALGPVGACEGPCHVAPNPPARPSPPRGSPGGSLPSTSVRLSVSLRLSVSVPLCLSLPFSACSVCLSLCLLFSVSVPLCLSVCPPLCSPRGPWRGARLDPPLRLLGAREERVEGVSRVSAAEEAGRDGSRRGQTFASALWNAAGRTRQEFGGIFYLFFIFHSAPPSPAVCLFLYKNVLFSNTSLPCASGVLWHRRLPVGFTQLC